MKRIGLILSAVVGLSLTANSQVTSTTFDLTTGVGTVGTSDPNWDVDIPGGGLSYTNAFITTGNNETTGGWVYTSWVQDSCGTYISPYIVAGTNNASQAGPPPPGNYTYRYRFNLQDCPVVGADLDVPFIAADNSVVSISVNGTALTIPGGITHTSPATFSASVPLASLIPGATNEVTVVVNNLGSWTSLQMCAELLVNQQCCDEELQIETCGNPCDNPDFNFPIWVTDASGNIITEPDYSFNWSNGSTSSVPVITVADLPITVVVTNNQTGCTYEITYDCPRCDLEAPVELFCESAGGGNVNLFWNPVSGAVSYIVEVHWDDPAFCSTGTPPTAMQYNAATNSLTISTASPCFSWRVRAVCEDGSLGPWSEFHGCSFDKGKVGQPTEGDAVDQEQNLSITPNPFGASVEIEFDQLPTDGIMKVQILDATGKVILNREMEATQSFVLNTEDWKTGMYLCRVEINNEVFTQKMIKQ